ncbi:MAG: hypothetical protein ACRD68_00055 [Pyrinomonadaceae bacterium]
MAGIKDVCSACGTILEVAQSQEVALRAIGEERFNHPLWVEVERINAKLLECSDADELERLNVQFREARQKWLEAVGSGVLRELKSKGCGTVEIWTRGVAGLFETQVFDPQGPPDLILEKRTWSTWEEAEAGHKELVLKWGPGLPLGWFVPVE